MFGEKKDTNTPPDMLEEARKKTNEALLKQAADDNLVKYQKELGEPVSPNNLDWEDREWGNGETTEPSLDLDKTKFDKPKNPEQKK